MEPTESNAAKILGRFLFISGCSAHVRGGPNSGHSFFVCGPTAPMGCSTCSLWVELSIPGEVFVNFHLGRPWCSINRPNFQENGTVWFIYGAPRPAEMKVREDLTGDR